MQNIKKMIFLFPGILAICYSGMLWKYLNMLEHIQQKRPSQFLAFIDVCCKQNINIITHLFPGILAIYYFGVFWPCLGMPEVSKKPLSMSNSMESMKTITHLFPEILTICYLVQFGHVMPYLTTPNKVN